ncbi:MAG: SpoIIE family protein phosphatase [Bacteroidales bacterium]|nr:SpoIIE family protein phosphatase [Bacteroidales bacterium]
MTKKNFFQNLKALMLVLVAAVTLEATALVQYYFSQKGIREEAAKRAEGLLEATSNEILDVIDQGEAAVRNNIWIAQWTLDHLDSMARVSYRLVQDNPVVAGSTVALVPGYNAKRPLFAPYVCRTDTDSLQILSLATPEYDYPNQEWFVRPVELNNGYWSEPYIDEGGGEMLMTTYSMPVRDKNGKTAAVITCDISLDWLNELIESVKAYPHSCCILTSRSGNVMVSPAGAEEVRNQPHLSFGTIIERTGWSMTLVIPKQELFASLKRIGLLVGILQLLGLAMLILMLRSYIKGQFRYKALDEKRQRIEGELNIATGIQMSMVPKTFPPFPDRNDLDMAATIVPAKEVGGDLYDFFIRDEKLFFCVGDVSGKGVPAALVMAVTRTTFRNLSAHEDSPGRIVKTMNDNLSSMNESNMFVTFFCGVLDLAGGMLRYCNAGHNPPRILTDAIRTLPVEPNLPLGIMNGFDYKEQEIQLQYDDALFLYTDGLTEAENPAHDQFGEERMEDSLRGRMSATGRLESIKKDVAAFVGEAPQSDDLTLLFIHYLPRTHRLTLHNDINQIALLPGFVGEAVNASKLDPAQAGSINLALEEAITNVMMYAYPEGTDGIIYLDAAVSGNALHFTITDCGKAFDPTAREEVDVNASVEERPVGGLGIHLVRQIMDRVRYERIGNKNILYLTKNY